MQNYYFAYHILPDLVYAYNHGQEHQPHVVDLHYIKQHTEQESQQVSWNHITIEHRALTEQKSVGIYRFEEQEELAETPYGLIFFDYEQHKASYYVLEQATEDEELHWSVFCIDEQGEKQDFGPFIMRPTASNFMNHIIEMYESDVLLAEFE